MPLASFNVLPLTLKVTFPLFMSVIVSSPAVILAVMLIVSPAFAVIGSIVSVGGCTVMFIVSVVVLYVPVGSV